MTGSFSGSRPSGRGPQRGGRFNSGAPRAGQGGFRGARSGSAPAHARADGAPSHARSHSSHTGSRPHSGGFGERRSFGGGSRFSGGRGGFGGSRGFGNRGGSRGSFGGGRSNRKPDEQIDIQRFINRSVVTEEVVTHFVPEHKFEDFAVSNVIKENLAKKGYELPTPIQDRAVPHIVRGEDVVGIANTGTGKTGAFLIPLIERVLASHREKKDLRVLIMVPTRELALQIEEEFRGFSAGLRLSSVIAVGGLNINPQMRALRRPHHFVIGTPGRIKDLVERKFLELPKFGTVVLDEADRMLDMGFIKDMREIMGQLPKDRHTLFFSATLSREVEALIGEFLKDPARISVKTRETSANIDQDIVKVPPGADKIEFLANMLKGPEFSKVLIFGRTKHGVDKLARVLAARGLKAECIHGNKTHNNRVRSLDMFKAGRAPILVATDVAARGLDIPNVTHVINYDVPATYDDYVHRIGRTGRGEKKGVALTFVS